MPARPEVGVHLREAAPLIRACKAMLISDYELINPEEALPDPDRVTVYLSNHGPVWAPLPAPVLTVDYLLSRGGYEELVAVTLFHRVVEYVPGMSPLLARYFGYTKRGMSSVPELTELMKQRRIQILGTVPEGRSCVFAYDDPVGPFTKFGLMVAALDAGADIVLTVQKGAEHFGVPARLPWKMRLPIPHRPRGLLLPLWYPGRRARIKLKYAHYRPLMSPAERDRLPQVQRRPQLQAEFREIRRQLIRLYESIP
jgi:hypothetical protein